jgi:hypothetical protein
MGSSSFAGLAAKPSNALSAFFLGLLLLDFVGLLLLALTGLARPSLIGLLRPLAIPPRCNFGPAITGVLLNPPASAFSTYCLKVASSGDPSACSLFGRGSGKVASELFGGEGVMARMVECAVDGRTGEVGAGGGCGRGRKCVDMLAVVIVV